MLAKERAKQKLEKERQRQILQADGSIDSDQQKILKNALLNSTVRSNAANNSSIDVVSVLISSIFVFKTKVTLKFMFSLQSFIKEEPEDISSDVDELNNVDPTQFLAQYNDDDEMDSENKHPPILASLGLTHISQVSVKYRPLLSTNLFFISNRS